MAETTNTPAAGTEKSPDQVMADYKAQKTKELLTYTGYALMFFGALYLVNKFF